MSDTRKLIDFAHDQNGSEFRDALYSAIHDKVTAHIDAKRAEIAQTLITQHNEDVEELDEATSVVGKPEHLGGDEKGQSLGVASAAVDGVATHHIHNGQKFKVESDVDQDGDVHHTVLDHKGEVVHYHMVTNDGWGKNERVGNKPSPDHAKLIKDHVRAAKPHLTAMADHIFPGKHQQEEGFPGPDYKSQVPTKPGEKAGFTSKKVSTGTVFSRVPPKVEPTKEK